MFSSKDVKGKVYSQNLRTQINQRFVNKIALDEFIYVSMCRYYNLSLCCSVLICSFTRLFHSSCLVVPSAWLVDKNVISD